MITKDFSIHWKVWDAMEEYDYYHKMSVVSEDRIREELQELVAESKGFCIDPEDVEILEVRKINK